MSHYSISKQVARRFVLGKQGLWPGRRWRGLEGASQALHVAERIQLDPLCVVARNHELALLSRVADCDPECLYRLLFESREFFDYGETLFIQPMDELPYWRAVMRSKATEPRWAAFAASNSVLLSHVKAELRTRGPLGSRDFDGNTRVNSYRASKDTGLALFYLWLVGELMTHHRVRFERVFDFTENIAPPALHYEVPLDVAERFLVRKAITFWGLCRARHCGNLLERKVSAAEGVSWVESLSEAGEIAPVEVEGQRELYYMLAADVALLETVAEGRIPDEWLPVGHDTGEEVTFLAPLDIVSARGRAKELFDFDYVWEVYKPAKLRRWGYYTLPILFGDCLVARVDFRLERKTGVLSVQGFWLEHASLTSNPGFAEALQRGMQRLVAFIGAQRYQDNPIRTVLPAYAALQSGLG